MAPEISAAVMMANVPWNAMNSTCGNRALRIERDAVQEQLGEVTDEGVPGAERQRVADQRPQDADEAERDDAHHHRVEGVLRADETTVEERECRRHQEHQRRGDQHPRGVGRVDGRRRRLGARERGQPHQKDTPENQ